MSSVSFSFFLPFFLLRSFRKNASEELTSLPKSMPKRSLAHRFRYGRNRSRDTLTACYEAGLDATTRGIKFFASLRRKSRIAILATLKSVIGSEALWVPDLDVRNSTHD